MADPVRSTSCVLSLGLSFTALLLGVLYFTLRRKVPIATLTTAFNQVDWAMYKERGPLSKRTREQQQLKQRRQQDLPVVPMEKVYVVEDDNKSETGIAL